MSSHSHSTSSWQRRGTRRAAWLALLVVAVVGPACTAPPQPPAGPEVAEALEAQPVETAPPDVPEAAPSADQLFSRFFSDSLAERGPAVERAHAAEDAGDAPDAKTDDAKTDGATPADGAVPARSTPSGTDRTPRAGPVLGNASTDADAATAAADRNVAALRGSLTTRFVRRRRGGDSDLDYFTYLTVDGGDPHRDAVTWHLDGRLSYDVDGDRGDQPYASVNDTYSGPLVGRLFGAWVDVDAGPELERMRLGRQTDYETPEIIFYDGVHIRTAPLDDEGTRLGVYGGQSVHDFESSADGDRVYGIYGDMRPWEGGRVRLDWLHAEDDRSLGSYEDDLFGVSVWQAASQAWRWEGSYTRFADEDRDMRVATTYVAEEARTVLRASYYELLRVQPQRAIEFDPLSTALFDLFPYYQAELSIDSLVTDDVTVLAGGSVRRVDDSSDEGQFNRDVERWFVTTSVDGLVEDETTSAFTMDRWSSDSQDNDSWGVDLSRPLDETIEATVGTYYSLYKTDVLLATEREDVRTWYVRFDVTASERVGFDFDYEYEDSSLGGFHNLRVRTTWRF